MVNNVIMKHNKYACITERDVNSLRERHCVTQIPQFRHRRNDTNVLRIFVQKFGSCGYDDEMSERF